MEGTIVILISHISIEWTYKQYELPSIWSLHRSAAALNSKLETKWDVISPVISGLAIAVERGGWTDHGTSQGTGTEIAIALTIIITLVSGLLIFYELVNALVVLY